MWNFKRGVDMGIQTISIVTNKNRGVAREVFKRVWKLKLVWKFFGLFLKIRNEWGKTSDPPLEKFLYRQQLRQYQIRILDPKLNQLSIVLVRQYLPLPLHNPQMQSQTTNSSGSTQISSVHALVRIQAELTLNSEFLLMSKFLIYVATCKHSASKTGSQSTIFNFTTTNIQKICIYLIPSVP